MSLKIKELLFFWICWFVGPLLLVTPFSSPNPNSSRDGHSLFDRFRSTCPANPSCIKAFDKSLVDDDDDNGIVENGVWVAVYRSSNNKPSVLVKDEFLNAMRIATEAISPGNQVTTGLEGSTELIETNQLSYEETPVAVARLRPSPEFEGAWLMDSMRCLLKKETTNDECDGGSEHTEALGVGIDSLILHHLSTQTEFEGAIRTKATLVSGPVLEERGFSPVESLSKDMASHVSSIDACIEGYSKRLVMQGAKNPGTRDRALQIISLLGRLDPEEQNHSLDHQAGRNDKKDDDDYDPWANIKKFI